MRQLVLLIAVIAGVSATAGWMLGHHTTRRDADDAEHGRESAPAAGPVPVRVAPAVRASFDYTLLAYGQEAVPPEALQGVSVPFDGLVASMACVVGQEVHRGDVLVEIAATAELKQQLAEARLARTTAEQDLGLVNQRRDLSLATQNEVAQAQHLFAAADQHLALLSQRFPGDGGAALQLRAPVDGMVAAIAAKPGTAVAAGAALVDVAPTSRREVRLGIDPNAAASLQLGHAIALQSLDSAADATVSGTLVRIGAIRDPTTRLIDAVVAVPADARLLDHERMVARIPVRLPDVLVIPRSALVSDDNGTKVLVVASGKAERTLITVIAEDDTRAAVSGPDIAAGTVVVSEGASILDDGQAVVVAGAPAVGAPAGAGAKP